MVVSVAVEETDHVYYHYSCLQEWEVEGLEPHQITPHPPQERQRGGQGFGMLEWRHLHRKCLILKNEIKKTKCFLDNEFMSRSNMEVAKDIDMLTCPRS